MARPKVDLSRHPAVSERVSVFAKENGIDKDRAWAELIVLGLQHKDEFEDTEQPERSGEFDPIN